ncbi:MAG TPA: 16S rRNA (uracil(1498)-N(3))-methyltransferase [Alphaproteobacteria bacterium]|nr:16S rRNA (uracil(1498)-N(3))-methyltransferase [Alphaproteobacteria bacterium]
MNETRPKIRLHVAAPLGPGMAAPLSAGQAHYLRSVMRLAPGAVVAAFNAEDGEWRARVERLDRKGGKLAPEVQLPPPAAEPDLWLLFAPVKRAPVDFLVQKATELGVSRLIPVETRRTVVERVNLERLSAIAIEAAEQCGRLSVPEVAPAQALDAALDGWPAGRPLYYCDPENGRPMLMSIEAGETAAALLVGPEGGFDERERGWLSALTFARPVGLGPRVLRAETAALAALALWQAAAGDWRGERTP